VSDRKRRALSALAVQRKQDCLPGYRRLSDFHGGAYDKHDFVSPWTLSAGNVDADLMIILQDWSSSKSLEGPFDEEAARLGHTPGLATNRNLKRLVASHFGLDVAETYVTNMFVFIKEGAMSAPIPLRDAIYSARKYAIPQIEIVRPRTVLCVGSLTYNAIRVAAGEARVSIRRGADTAFNLGESRLYGVPHTGGLGMAGAGGTAAVEAMWSAIAAKHRRRN
jgi:hypothetical protein